MSESPGVGVGRSLLGGEEFSRDATLEVLSNRRRRYAIHCLKRRGGRVSVSDLSEQVAAWENDKPVEELSYTERKRVRNALRQFHLPKMVDRGFVEYDSDRETVELTEAAASANFYVDSLTGGNIPWGGYYLLLSAASASWLVGLLLGVYPFDIFSPRTFGLLLVTALTMSSLGHLYHDRYRMRLGASDRPPEVERP
jgi:hypothetical protein